MPGPNLNAVPAHLHDEINLVEQDKLKQASFKTCRCCFF